MLSRKRHASVSTELGSKVVRAHALHAPVHALTSLRNPIKLIPSYEKDGRLGAVVSLSSHPIHRHLRNHDGASDGPDIIPCHRAASSLGRQ